MKYLKYTFLAVITTLFYACDDEDYTGDSSLVPTSPTISVDLGAYAGGLSFTEQDSTVLIGVTLSEPQIVDVAVYITQSGGEATMGSDFVIDNSNGRVLIPAGRTTGTVSISVMSDDIEEDTETFTIQIGDHRTANASITPTTVSFSINNYQADDLVVGLSWSATVFDATGAQIPATGIADLRLLVTDPVRPYTTVLGSADGGAFESFTMSAADFADGDYYIVADFYDAIDLGDQGTVSLDLDLTFDQAGTINGDGFSFTGALNTLVTCGANHVYLARVTKNGTSYSFERLGLPSVENASFVGPWTTGYDTDNTPIGYIGDSKIVASLNGDGDLVLDSINVNWMFDVWGEEVLVTVPTVLDVDLSSFTFEIEEQYIFTTLYDGAEYPYNIRGGGSIDICNNEVTIVYEMIQDGFVVDDWLFANGFMLTDDFYAVVNY